MLDKYLIDNYDKLKDMAYNVTGGNSDKDDLFSFVVEELYNADQKKLNKLIAKKQLTFYVARIMINQYFSKTSRFYYKYKKYYSLAVTEINDSITTSVTNDNESEKKQYYINKIKKKLEQCHWFDSQIFKLYYTKDHSLNSLSAETKINRNTIYHTLNKVKKFIKK
tara:strand:+ start:267 stop:764 length:498 start_codon:yes stop_codon:yes gene_type:complete